MSKIADKINAQGARIAELQAENRQLYEALGGLKRGNCFCDMAIGHPLHDRHSDACIKAQAALAAVEGK